jgi:lysyl-tRNA synthetase class 2
VRNQGKAGFLDLSDGRSRIQVYVRRDAVGDAAFELYRLLDLGDWVGVEGDVFRTRTGELSSRRGA